MRLTNKWREDLKSYNFISILDRCRRIIRDESPGHNILRYLLYNMNNVIIKNQHDSLQNKNLSNSKQKWPRQEERTIKEPTLYRCGNRLS